MFSNAFEIVIVFLFVNKMVKDSLTANQKTFFLENSNSV